MFCIDWMAAMAVKAQKYTENTKNVLNSIALDDKYKKKTNNKKKNISTHTVTCGWVLDP